MIAGQVTAAGLLLAGEDTGKAGPLGLLIVVLLGIACYWLFRSMSKHLRRVPGTFDQVEQVTPVAPGPDRPASTIAPPPIERVDDN